MMKLLRRTYYWMIEPLYKVLPWIVQVGDILYDCWQCIYEPLFWLMYLFSCTWESHQQQKQRYFDDMMTFSVKDGEFHLSVTEGAIPSIINTDISINQNESNGGNVQTFRYSKSYIKRIIKAHIKSIRQKQRLLNSMMKRSLLRRTKKFNLIQQPVPTADATFIPPAVPMFIRTKLMDGQNHGSRDIFLSPLPPVLHCHRSKKFISPLRPLKTLAHQGNLTPEIASLSKSLNTLII